MPTIYQKSSSTVLQKLFPFGDQTHGLLQSPQFDNIPILWHINNIINTDDFPAPELTSGLRCPVFVVRLKTNLPFVGSLRLSRSLTVHIPFLPCGRSMGSARFFFCARLDGFQHVSTWSFLKILNSHGTSKIKIPNLCCMVFTCQPWINKPLGCLIGRVPFMYHIVTIWRVPP